MEKKNTNKTVDKQVDGIGTEETPCGEQTEELQETVKADQEVVKETAEQGKTADMPEGKKVPAKDKKDDKTGAFLVPYRKAYPNEKAFHITSDKQVFLEKDRSLAIMHQNSLKNGEQVTTIKVK